MSDRDDTQLARRIVEQFGGRFSVEAGIDVDAEGGIDRWFLASTLFGNRIDSHIATNAYRALDRSGVHTLHDLDGTEAQDLVDLLDSVGYTRYDLRTAARLLHLGHEVQRRHPEGITPLFDGVRDAVDLRARLEALPGWGPVTTAAFLRELPIGFDGVEHQVDPMAERAALHLHLDHDGSFTSAELRDLAVCASLDVRDVEAALIRVALAHHRSFTSCERNDPQQCMQLRRTAQ